MKTKRALLLVPLSAGLVFAAVTGLGDFAGGKSAFAALVSAVSDPLALIAARSPGLRGSGVLLSIKPERTAANAVPHERVLSSERERDPPTADIPGAALPDFIPADAPGAGPGNASGFPGTSGGASPAFGGSPPLPVRFGFGVPPNLAAVTPPVTVIPGGGGSGAGDPGTGPGADPGADPIADVSSGPPGAPGDGIISPAAPTGDGGDPGFDLPPLLPIGGPGDLPVTPQAPGLDPGPPDILPPPLDPPAGPGDPPVTPPGTPPGGTTDVPEAPSGTMMLLGLLAAGCAARRRARRLI